MENEGQAVNKPLLLNGGDYDYWKRRTITFYDAHNMDIWEVIETCYQVATDVERVELPRAQGTNGERTKYQQNSKVRHYFNNLCFGLVVLTTPRMRFNNV